MSKITGDTQQMTRTAQRGLAVSAWSRGSGSKDRARNSWPFAYCTNCWEASHEIGDQ